MADTLLQDRGYCSSSILSYKPNDSSEFSFGIASCTVDNVHTAEKNRRLIHSQRKLGQGQFSSYHVLASFAGRVLPCSNLQSPFANTSILRIPHRDFAAHYVQVNNFGLI